MSTLSSLPCLESLAPTSDVPMLNPPTLEGAHGDPTNTSGSLRREVGSSRSSFCNEFDLIKEDSRQTFVHFRRDQRKLKAELPNFRSILPHLTKPRRNLVPIPNSTQVRGNHFHVHSGLIYIDFVKEPGVGARMIYVIVLPQDEQEFFGI